MKKATITFGRMNPPTVGHQKLVNKVVAVARSKRADPRVYLSHTQNARKDPLKYAQKIKNARAAFGNVVKQSNIKNIVGIMQSLEKEGIEEVTMVVGSDRVSNFRTFLNKYNGKDFNFKKITVVSAGTRDPDAAGVAGMSASKMRQLAAAGKEKEFAAGAPTSLSQTQKKTLYKDVRTGMNIREEIELINEELMLEELSDKDIEDFIKSAPYGALDPDVDDVEMGKHIFRKAYDKLKKDKDNPEKDDDDDDDDGEEKDLNERKPLTFQQRQKIAIRMKRLAPRMKRLRAIKKKRMATPDRLKYRSRKAALMLLRRRAAGSRGAKYATLSRTDKINIDRQLNNRYKGPALRNIVDRFAKRMLPMVRKKEMERLKRVRTAKKEDIDIQFETFITEKEDTDIGDRKGNQPAQYHSGLKVSTKKKRDTQFQRQAKMKDDNPRAYKKAPGDSAKTKPSQYTTRYKQMYGEDVGEKEIKVGNYQTTHFHMCGSAIKAMKKHANVDGAEELTKLQDQYFKMEKGVMDRGSATDSEKNKARFLHDKIMQKAKEAGIEKDLKGYMSDHLNSVTKGDPKPGFGLVENVDANFESFLEESSALDRLKKFDKSRQAAGKKPIFTPNKPTKLVKMKKKGLMTTMNVPSDQVQKYKDNGWYTIGEDAALDKVAKKLEKASKAHAAQAKIVKKHADSMDEQFEQFLEYTVTPSSHLAPTSAPRDIIPSVFSANDKDPSDETSKRSKVDVLMRLGLVPKDELVKYRRALRNRDAALKNPELRQKLNKLLDKLLDFSTKDSTVYQKLRKAVTTKEDMSALAKKHDDEKERLKLRHTREKGAAKTRAVRQDNLKDETQIQEKALTGLKNKAEKSGISYSILKQVYNRGMAAWKTGHRPGASQQQWAYARVNSFITGGGARKADNDLWSKVKK